MKTNQQIREEFAKEVAQELGYVSALFMSQECKGTEIVMPSKELKEAADRIGLYAFAACASELAELKAKVEGMKKSNCGCPPFQSLHDGPCRHSDYTDYNQALSDVLAFLPQPEYEN